MQQLEVSHLESNQRLDKFILRYLKNCPQSFLYKCFRTNKIKYNGKKPKGNELLQTGDIIKIFLLDDQIEEMQGKATLKKVAQQFKIIFEDDNILIVDKPMGLLTQKANKADNSLAEQILSYLDNKNELEGLNGFKPAPSNRLDRNTAGLVISGKNLAASRAISDMLKEKNISKYYLTIVKGIIEKPITLHAYHTKLDGNKARISDYKVGDAKPIETKISPLKIIEGYTVLEVKLITGKTHQIRAHLSQIGYPIIGDTKYGDQKVNKYFEDKYQLRSQFLCAYKIKFEECDNILDYLENRVFIANVPMLYTKILEGETNKI
ncbi:MAG: hypothetical protein ATN35_10870 [Epulopiscium sp. Nele67-Bin004]|nr:MAG: hypothetical protein ATN35_10870 [Epulopiscium sp. Nele67-Bin004]